MPNGTSLDYAAILERIPVEFKRETYERMLKGSTDERGQKLPGLETQFMEALAEARAFKEMVETRQGIVDAMTDEPPEGLLKQARADLAQMYYLLAVKEERLSGIAAELNRIQDALDSIKRAGSIA